MMCGCSDHEGHGKCMQISGAILLVVGLVYVAESLGWISVNLPNFWALLLVLFGILMVMEAKACEK